MPLVSVIMPAYNAARYIAQAINSVLAQTLTDWELIVVDDGSTDTTQQVLAMFVDPRIIKVYQANSGEACARNAALDRAQGKYVTFLDSDDLYLPQALADLSGFLDQHDEYDAAYSDGFFCDEQDRPLMRLSEHRATVYTGSILEPLVLSASVISGIICTITRRSLIEQQHIRFDSQFVIGPDWDFWIETARHARFGYLDRTTCMYRVHETNITRTSGMQRRKDDLVRGRMKVLNATWFADLSVSTRRQFFFDLLIELLGGHADRQHAILKSAQFQQLPVKEQADVWRQVGTDCLLTGRDRGFATRCLQRAYKLNPADRKSRYLLRTMRLGGTWSVTLLLKVWQFNQSAMRRVRAIGKRQSQPVPAALGPVQH